MGAPRLRPSPFTGRGDRRKAAGGALARMTSKIQAQRAPGIFMIGARGFCSRSPRTTLRVVRPPPPQLSDSHILRNHKKPHHHISFAVACATLSRAVPLPIFLRKTGRCKTIDLSCTSPFGTNGERDAVVGFLAFDREPRPDTICPRQRNRCVNPIAAPQGGPDQTRPLSRNQFLANKLGRWHTGVICMPQSARTGTQPDAPPAETLHQSFLHLPSCARARGFR